MDQYTNENSGRIKLDDALEIYFNEAGVPHLVRDSLKGAMIEGLDNTTEQGGIWLSDYGFEVYETDSVYYLDASAFNYVMEQIRLKGVSSNSCRGRKEIDPSNE